MPSLALTVEARYPSSLTREFARRLGAVYAELMQTEPETITVVVGQGGVWRCSSGGDPVPAALLMCDIRRGRTVERRERLSRALIAVCAECLDLDPGQIKVEYTQHDGDEMFHPHLGGFNRDWSEPEPAG